MAKKYTYSRTFGIHTFTANEFDSFDEAVKAVEKGIYDFKLANPKEKITTTAGPAKETLEIKVEDLEIKVEDLEIKVEDDVKIEEKIN